jgi:hypothetical protein
MKVFPRAGRLRLGPARSARGRGRIARPLWGIIILLIVPCRAASGIAPGLLPRPHQEPAAQSSLPPTGPGERSRELEQKIASVATSDVNALARALGVPLVESKAGGEDKESPLSEASQLRLLGQLDGKQDPECVLFLSGHEEREDGRSAAANWDLDFLAWDGTRWRLSALDPSLSGGPSEQDWKSHSQPLGVNMISRAAGGQLAALVLYDASTAAVYPVVFKVQDYQATLVWDSRSERSRYEALSGGQIKFVAGQGGGVPAMVASGKADPGLLVFARDGGRGFEVRTIYAWKGDEYLPSGTEYEANEDFRLYEFISALHLHNYKAAYALIDPARFLGTDKPGLDAFRELIQKSWSEFLGDAIFTASEEAGTAHTFELDRGGKKSRYLPTFSAGPKFLLTGLTRQEE